MLNKGPREIVHLPKLLAGVVVGRKGREPDMATVGGRIAAARKASGLTMEQLAARIGVSKSAISQWERGRIDKLSAENLLKLAEALEVSPRWIWLWKDSKGKTIPMGKEAHLEPDESDLVETFKVLEPDFRDELLGDAHKYLRLSAKQQPSRTNPYPQAPKPKKPVR